MRDVCTSVESVSEIETPEIGQRTFDTAGLNETVMVVLSQKMGFDATSIAAGLFPQTLCRLRDEQSSTDDSTSGILDFDRAGT